MINSILISPRDVRAFEEDGAIVLRDLISPVVIQAIRETFEKIAISTPLGFTARYKRMTYNLEDHTDIFDQITGSENFGKITEKLTGRQLILTQVLGLESEPHPEVAVKWHYDQTSYGFVDVDVPAFGLWFPLVNIYSNKQRGGISWVSKQKMSAQAKLSRWEDYYHRLYDLKLEHGEQYEALNREFNYTTEYGLDWLTESDYQVLEENEVEFSFEVGDAVLMDRNVYHRSTPYLDGPIERRLVCVMRFVDAEAELNRKLFEGLNIHARIENRILPRIFISKLIDVPNRGKIASSRYSPKAFPAR